MVTKKTPYSTTISRIPSPWSHSQKVGNYMSDSLTSAFFDSEKFWKYGIFGHAPKWVWSTHKASNRITWDLPGFPIQEFQHSSHDLIHPHTCLGPVRGPLSATNIHWKLQKQKLKTDHLKDHRKSDALEVEVVETSKALFYFFGTWPAYQVPPGV